MNKFLENIFIMALIAFITLTLIHKPIDIGYKIFIEYGVAYGVGAMFLTFFIQLLFYASIYGIVFASMILYEWINKKKDE